jgi:hypothetical protein
MVLYATTMAFVLLKIQCKVQTNAIVLMVAFLFPFCTKTIADGLRVYQDETNPIVQASVTMSVYLSEHVRTLVMMYLAFIVHDVRSKMEANDV